MNNTLEEKRSSLLDIAARLVRDGVLLAFSGGVDSALLLRIFADSMKTDSSARVECVIFTGVMFPRAELQAAERFAAGCGIVLHVIKREMIPDELKSNPRNRCYLCKHSLFKDMSRLASARALPCLADGTNADDLLSYRPGLKALAELSVSSPLAEAGLTKADVRAMATGLGIVSAGKPSSPCLATRFAYGEELTLEKFNTADEVERLIRERGVSGNIRVRFERDSARIEVDPASFGAVIAMRGDLCLMLKKRGVVHLSLDLEGFRSGSMDIIHTNNISED